MLKTNLPTMMQYLFKDGLYRSFYRLIDYAVDNNTGMQFPRSLFIDIHKRDISNHPDKVLSEMFGLDQMIEAGVFLEPTKNSHMISLHQDFFNFLVYLDSTRAKQFSDKEFEELRQAMALVCKNLKRTADNEDSDDYRESWVHFYSVVNNIISSVDKNLIKLTSSVDEVAELYNQIHNKEINMTVTDLYKKAIVLQERHITPCYEFLDSERPLLRMFVDLRDFFIKRGEEGKAIKVIESEHTIAHHRQILNSIKERLNNNLDNMREERNILLAGEEVFNNLMIAMNDVRTGRAYNTKLDSDCPAFEGMGFYEGLYQYSSTENGELLSPPKDEDIEWREFESWLQMISDKPLPEKTTSPKRLKNAKQKTKGKDIPQLLYMSQVAVAVNQEPNVYIEDLYLFVYKELSKKIENITIDYFLEGLESFLGSLNHREIYVRATGIRKTLSDSNKRLDYTVIRYKKQLNPTKE